MRGAGCGVRNEFTIRNSPFATRTFYFMLHTSYFIRLKPFLMLTTHHDLLPFASFFAAMTPPMKPKRCPSHETPGRPGKIPQSIPL